MSILLDALRKSEKSQKPAGPPNIHSNDMPMTEPTTINKSLVAILLIVALLIIGWLVWRQYQPDTAAYRPPVELPVGRVPQVVKEATEPPPTEVKSVAPKTVAEGTSRPRTPVESYQPSPEEVAAQRQAKVNAAAKKRAAARKAAAESVAPSSVAKLEQDATNAPAISAARKPAAKTSAKKPATQKADQSTAKDNYQSPEPQPISYWELPDNIREGVPEIKFSVLVYDSVPANRFVLVNGERYVEGDTPAQGLVLEEIRRDGVIFSYRLYRFFVER